MSRLVRPPMRRDAAKNLERILSEVVGFFKLNGRVPRVGDLLTLTGLSRRTIYYHTYGLAEASGVTASVSRDYDYTVFLYHLMDTGQLPTEPTGTEPTTDEDPTLLRELFQDLYGQGNAIAASMAYWDYVVDRFLRADYHSILREVSFGERFVEQQYRYGPKKEIWLTTLSSLRGVAYGHALPRSQLAVNPRLGLDEFPSLPIMSETQKAW